jgi:1-acyl-sn-glycerol-3-phosphate acyltransferase
VVIASKHQSAWETLAFQCIFHKPTWVLKRELLWIPFFGWGLAAIAPIAINRGQRRQAMQQVLTQGIARLAAGHSVIIFPEGTRVAPGERKRYGLGAANFAIAANVPIVPVAHNAGIFWRRKEFIKRPGTIHVVIGEPISVEGKTPQAIMTEVENWVENTMTRLG